MSIGTASISPNSNWPKTPVDEGFKKKNQEMPSLQYDKTKEMWSLANVENREQYSTGDTSKTQNLFILTAWYKMTSKEEGKGFSAFTDQISLKKRAK